MKDLCITIPKKEFWDWRQYLNEKEDKVFYFKIPFFPLEYCSKCYAIHKNKIIGYFDVTAFIEVKHSFEELEPGKYIYLNSKNWHKIDPIKSKSHRGFTYLESIDSILNVYSVILKDAINEVIDVLKDGNNTPSRPSKSKERKDTKRAETAQRQRKRTN